MSLSNRNNPYNFDEFLAWRNEVNYYTDDPFLQKVVKHYAGDDWKEVDREARAISPKVSYRWRDMADFAASPQEMPYMVHYDAHNHRIDRIVRPHQVEIMEKEIFSEAIFSEKTSPWTRLVKMFLIYQNGEACVSCPLTCTEGMVALLDKFADTPETKAILQHCKEGIDGSFSIGAQYLSEIQGGSDVPANVLEAVQERDTWKLYGTKFFCSATHADYAVVTAKPAGSEEVALFVVPSWLPGNKEKEIRNGYTIDRIKNKLGTRELTTAEITYNGAIAYPAGPLDRGVANVVGIVLTYSRLTVGLSAASGMARTAREARKYSELREAFGFKIGQFPLLAGQLNKLEKYARRTTAGAFKLYSEFLSNTGEDKKQRFKVRELIMLQKIAGAMDSTEHARLGMSVYGGHGVMEDFSSLPRILRDAIINELWEGPRNVLLSQIFLDLQKVSEWYPADEFVRDVLSGGDETLVNSLTDEILEITGHGTLLDMNEKTLEICEKWDSFCHKLFHAYQDIALKEVEG
ncbi:MAG: acyl-CoA dehydrogenase [bacterium]|nr:acyl-CoA dehydrogenase [bacterium]